jgi:hypothetical protein
VTNKVLEERRPAGDRVWLIVPLNGDATAVPRIELGKRFRLIAGVWLAVSAARLGSWNDRCCGARNNSHKPS